MKHHTTSKNRSQAVQEPIVYLLHFDRPFHHAKHYCGFTANLENRIRLHATGQSGVPLMRAVHKAGISFQVVRTWKNGTRELERMIKDRHNLADYCPQCKQARLIQKLGLYPTPLKVAVSQATFEDIASVPAR